MNKDVPGGKPRAAGARGAGIGSAGRNAKGASWRRGTGDCDLKKQSVSFSKPKLIRYSWQREEQKP